MVSIDALFEVVEAVYGHCSVRLEKRDGQYIAMAHTADGAVLGGASGTPSGAIESMASRLAAEVQDRAKASANAAFAATKVADTAQRLAIQAKRVVDGFAQGASE